MHNSKKKTGRKVLAGAAIGVASIAMVLGAATAANAATGGMNAGVTNLQVIPTSPATSFATPGTNGVLRFNTGDGTATKTATFAPGTTSTAGRSFTLPAGLKFLPAACAPNTATYTCTISADGRTQTTSNSIVIGPTDPALIDTTDYSATTRDLPIQSTGIISGNVTATFTPYTGLTTAAGSATLPQSQIPGAGSGFTATGATGPDANGDYTLTGTAQPGAEITVKDSTGSTVGTTTADANGNWSATIPSGVTPPLSITQKVGNDVSAPIEFNTAPLPVMNGVVAAGAIALAGLGFGGVRLFRRSRVTA
ncbi:Ig-like domain-containing protein [Leifsonia soli]|uniref:Bacterial Ig domain-containing protein n=1 Tax=Leifsonia soli TaxID=582665 RepID=A0A852T1V8_9MICO|nr:Ig-like domain-containing protein [Leifsonia soli]NYD74812.1 hypothetical protein [Leifsonia soli]